MKELPFHGGLRSPRAALWGLSAPIDHYVALCPYVVSQITECAAMPWEQFNGDIGCIHKALHKHSRCILDLEKVQVIHWLVTVQQHVAVHVEPTACSAGVSNDAYQSRVRYVVKRDRHQVVPQLSETVGITGYRNSRFECALHKPQGELRLLRSECNHPDVGLDPVSLGRTSLVKCQASRVPDGKCGHDRLRPRGPLALSRAHRRKQPAAIVNWIGHATSPVFVGGIVCGGGA